MNKYLVTYEIEGELYHHIETAHEIFSRMEFSDCYDIEIISISWLKPYNSAKEFRLATNPYPSCKFSGLWCNYNPTTGKLDPLRMEIRQKFGDMEVLDVGYVDEH